MKKYAANYLVSDTGVFLKNGIVITRADGSIEQYIDTEGDLREVEQLSFHNGILISGFAFARNWASISNSSNDNLFESLLLQLVAGAAQLSVEDYIDLGKELQIDFPDMKIPVIMNEMTMVLLSEGRFQKQSSSGLYLLTGLDLINLHFTHKSRLKKII